MKKIKTAMTICKRFKHVYSVGYCGLCYIAPRAFIEPQYYNCGAYGWNCDLYVDYENDTVITTGYRNTCGPSVPLDVLDKYSKRAAGIDEKNYKTFDEIQNAYYENFKAFIKELNEENNHE